MLSQDVKEIKEDQKRCLHVIRDMLAVLQQIAATLAESAMIQTAVAADVAEIKKAVVEAPPDTKPVGTVAIPGEPTERP